MSPTTKTKENIVQLKEGLKKKYSKLTDADFQSFNSQKEWTSAQDDALIAMLVTKTGQPKDVLKRDIEGICKSC